MAPRVAGDYDDWEEDPDAPQECDLDDEDDETLTVPCPTCGRPVAEIAERCPHCGDWIVSGGDTGRTWPRWVIVAAVLALVSFVLWYVL